MGLLLDKVWTRLICVLRLESGVYFLSEDALELVGHDLRSSHAERHRLSSLAINDKLRLAVGIQACGAGEHGFEASAVVFVLFVQELGLDQELGRASGWTLRVNAGSIGLSTVSDASFIFILLIADDEHLF